MLGKISPEAESLNYIFQKKEAVNSEPLPKGPVDAEDRNITAAQARGTQDTVRISEEARRLSRDFLAKTAGQAVLQPNSYVDETGSQKMAPDQTDEPQEEESPVEDGEEKNVLWCTADSSEVEAEIEELKQRVKQVEEQLKNATDEEERQDLENQLRQTKIELSLKDNEGYIRAHTKMTFSEEDPR